MARVASVRMVGGRSSPRRRVSARVPSRSLSAGCMVSIRHAGSTTCRMRSTSWTLIWKLPWVREWRLRMSSTIVTTLLAPASSIWRRSLWAAVSGPVDGSFRRAAEAVMAFSGVRSSWLRASGSTEEA